MGLAVSGTSVSASVGRDSSASNVVSACEAQTLDSGDPDLFLGSTSESESESEAHTLASARLAFRPLDACLSDASTAGAPPAHRRVRQGRGPPARHT